MAGKPRHDHYLGLHRGGWHRIAYTEWGERENPHIVVCVHGLTRNGRDFDALAQALASHRRVVCMDVVGRGDSDWLEDAGGYGFPVYEPDVAALIARVTATARDARDVTIDWVGTSMGGLLGITLAARAATPIRRLVLNDIGPYLSSAALRRIRATHARAAAEFETLEQVEQQMRVTYATFGPLTDEQWRQLAIHGSRRTERGTFRFACDPAAVLGPAQDATRDTQPADPPPIDLWRAWDRVRCPTLVLRGAVSDVLSAETAREMQTRGPRARVVEFAGIGHAPWLVEEGQIAPVCDFLLAS
ncbi:MAG: alpha/beta fold hydrolase [Rhodospirillaceae bacterium]